MTKDQRALFERLMQHMREELAGGGFPDATVKVNLVKGTAEILANAAAAERRAKPKR
jgi:hypothetical protein